MSVYQSVVHINVQCICTNTKLDTYGTQHIIFLPVRLCHIVPSVYQKFLLENHKLIIEIFDKLPFMRVTSVLKTKSQQFSSKIYVYRTMYTTNILTYYIVFILLLLKNKIEYIYTNLLKIQKIAIHDIIIKLY